MQQCTVDDCEEEAAHRYTWAWGEEGACCDMHRLALGEKAVQLSRGISFATLDTRPHYRPPTLREISPEVGALRMQNAEQRERISQLETLVVELQDKITALETQLGG